jgi:ATP-dependent DNA helicase PIF1
MLDNEQRYAIDLINLGRNVFLTGGGGTGKSYVLEYFIKSYRDKYPEDYKKFLGITSLTGSSALLIGGTTIHSFSGIGVSKLDDIKTIEKVVKHKHIKKKWTDLKVLIIDEISMMTPRFFRLLNLLGQHIKKNYLPFGGIQIILSGDFCQLSPILEPNLLHTMDYCFETDEWKTSNIYTIYFKTIHRQSDIKFIKALEGIRLGICNLDTSKLLLSRYKANLNNDHNILPTQLYPTRDKVNDINQKHFIEISKDKEVKIFKIEFDFTSKKNVVLDSNERLIIEKKITNNLPINDILNLCKGLQVILVVNLDIENGLVNGSKGVVVDFSDEGFPLVEFLNGTIRTISTYKWDIDDYGLLVKVNAIPLVLGYACTIHKSQGMSIDLAIIDAGRNIFSGNAGYGQMYVALSRVRSLNGLSLIGYDPTKIRCHPKVKEFYKKIEIEELLDLSSLEIPIIDKSSKKKKKKEILNQSKITQFLSVN